MNIITHYTKLSTLLNFILENKSFRFNLLSNTKDPYEYCKRYASIGCVGDYKPEMHMIQQISDEIREKKIKVGCFVAEKDGDIRDIQSSKSILNAPLWAHYGDNYNGAALVFDKNLLIDSCKKLIIHDWAIHKDKINYDDEYNLSNPPNEARMEDFETIDEINVAKYVFEKSKNFWFHKDPKWSYEDEFRIMIYSDTEGPIDVNIQDCIKGIVFGEKVSTFLTNSLETSLKEMKIGCFRISFDASINRLVCKVA